MLGYYGDDDTPYRMDDKLIEVVGMYSSLHIGTIQVSLAEPLRIGQASEVKVCSVCDVTD